MLEYVEPTTELLEEIAADMRDQDVEEVWASHRHTPLQALLYGWRLSDFSVVLTSKGKPLVMIGLVKGCPLTGWGTVWMLGANEALKYKKEFIRQVPPVIKEMLVICPRIGNMVHDRNKVSITWLKRIGFTIGEQVKVGPDREIFHRFHLER